MGLLIFSPIYLTFYSLISSFSKTWIIIRNYIMHNTIISVYKSLTYIDMKIKNLLVSIQKIIPRTRIYFGKLIHFWDIILDRGHPLLLNYFHAFIVVIVNASHISWFSFFSFRNIIILPYRLLHWCWIVRLKWVRIIWWKIFIRRD